MAKAASPGALGVAGGLGGDGLTATQAPGNPSRFPHGRSGSSAAGAGRQRVEGQEATGAPPPCRGAAPTEGGGIGEWGTRPLPATSGFSRGGKVRADFVPESPRRSAAAPGVQPAGGGGPAKVTTQRWLASGAEGPDVHGPREEATPGSPNFPHGCFLSPTHYSALGRCEIEVFFS